jgi:hypothetical protein
MADPKRKSPTGAAEHGDHMGQFITVAFMNIGLMETAFHGKNSPAHMVAIKRQVDQLFAKHTVNILCLVEVGVPREGLTPESKKKFEGAVLAGATEHGHSQLTFLWADLNEAMVVVHTKHVKMINGPLLTNLNPHQSWRNSMQLYLQGPTKDSRVKIFVSHQPSSEKHRLTQACRESVIRHLMEAGNDVGSWAKYTGATEHIEIPRYLIGGDLNTELYFLKMTARSHTRAPIETTCHDQNKRPKHGDYVVGINVNLIQVDCQVKNRDAQHEIVLARFPWPSNSQDVRPSCRGPSWTCGRRKRVHTPQRRTPVRQR